MRADEASHRVPALVQHVREPHQCWRAVGFTGNQRIGVVSKVSSQFLEESGGATNRDRHRCL
jgi:hypothetical protein